MKKKILLLVLASIVSLSFVACGGKNTTEGGDTVKNENESVPAMDVKDLIGDYIDVYSGKRMSYTSGGSDIQIEGQWSGFQFAPFMGTGWIKIEGNQLKTEASKETWDIIKTENGYQFKNDDSFYVSEDEFRKFECITPNQIGEEISTDIVSLKVSDYKIDKTTMSGKISQVDPIKVGDKYLYNANDGKCFVDIEFDIDNKDTDEFTISDVICISLVYDNKYEFSSYETVGNMLTVLPDKCSYVLEYGATYGTNPILSALSHASCIAHIMCPDVVMDTPDSPLSAVIRLKNSGENGKIFVYNLR